MSETLMKKLEELTSGYHPNWLSDTWKVTEYPDEMKALLWMHGAIGMKEMKEHTKSPFPARNDPHALWMHGTDVSGTGKTWLLVFAFSQPSEHSPGPAVFVFYPSAIKRALKGRIDHE